LLEQGNAKELCEKTNSDSLLDAFLQLSGETLPTDKAQRI